MSDRPDIVRTLREQLRSEQRALLDRIWKHQRATGGVLPRLQLHLEQGDADEVQRILLPLGASVVQLQGRNGDEPAGYRLTIIGALLTTEGEAIEALLGAILADIRVRQSTDHKFTVYDHVAFTNLCGMYPAATLLVPVLFRMNGPFQWSGSADPKNVQLTVPEEISEALLKNVDTPDLVRTLVGKSYRQVSSLDPSSLWGSPSTQAALRVPRSLGRGIMGGVTSTSPLSLLRELLDERVLVAVEPDFVVQHYDTAVFKALREVEIRVREVSGLGKEHVGPDLMRKAFHSENGPLADQTAERAERDGMGHLFAGAFLLYRNPTAHTEVGLTAEKSIELFVLASHMLRIVAERETALKAQASPSTG